MRVRGELRGDAPERWTRVIVTGHRDLTTDQRSRVDEQLDRVAAKLIAEHGMRIAIHGAAIGADLAWARASDEAGVDALWAYLPIPQQPDRWSYSQRKAWTHYTTLRTADGVPGRATRSEFLAKPRSVDRIADRSGLSTYRCN